MGDSPNDTVRVDFDRQIKLEFHDSTVISDAGLLAYRELDDALRLTSTAATGLHGTRTGQNTQHNLLALHQGQGGIPRAVRHLLTRRGGGTAGVMRGDPGTDRPATAGVRLGLRFATPDQPARTSSPCVRGAPGEAIAEQAWRKAAGCGGFMNQPNAAGKPP